VVLDAKGYLCPTGPLNQGPFIHVLQLSGVHPSALESSLHQVMMACLPTHHRFADANMA